MTLRVVIAEDEPLARRRLARMLEMEGCEVIAELPHGQALLDWLSGGDKVDALFLDIQMPGLTGLEVLAEIQDPPPVIFVTAHLQYTLQAFEAAATDYLLKPVTRPRLLTTLERLRKTQVPRRSGSEILQIVDRDTGTRFPARVGDGFVFLDIRKVTHFEVDNETVYACINERFRTSWTTLADVQRAFPQAGFIRIQRHQLVRPEMIIGLRMTWGGRGMLRLAGGLELEATRSAIPKLKERLGLA